MVTHEPHPGNAALAAGKLTAMEPIDSFGRNPGVNTVKGTELSENQTDGRTPFAYGPEIEVRPVVPSQPMPSLRTPVVLFVLTLLSTYLAGGIYYAASIMAILLAHELGHFTMCRRYSIPATYPYFIPFPLSIFGTLGALIMMRGRVPNRRALFDVGIAGPIAGLFIAIPVTLIGLQGSTVLPAEQVGPDAFRLGNSLLFSFLTDIAVGQVPDGHELMLGPMAYAGWAGLFVTALNLLPVGQLDGGHVVYAIAGEKSKIVYRLALLGVVVVTAITRFPGWLIIGLLAFLLARRHPPPMDPHTELDPTRKLIGLGAIIVFILAFIPAPFSFS
jgi:membrane-associated protease RseP (regulator of RpoE activity)